MARRPATVLAVLLASLVAGALPAHGAPGSGPTAVVALGDSYISGEAGRWAGNSITPVGDKDGTDRACVPPGALCREDESRVYLGGSDRNGCHRSDVAGILSAAIPVAERVNLSCSGGVTSNVFRSVGGGQPRNGEPPQGDQLEPVARAKDVGMVVLSVGGNDLGFAAIVRACVTAYVARSGPCRPAQQRVIDARIARATQGVVKAIDEIRAVMASAGYDRGDFRLVLQTYPAVIPRAAEMRYGENDPTRLSHGCPFYDEDLDWARDVAGPQLGAMVKVAAAARGAEVLDLRDALQGHEVCSRTTRTAAPGAPVNGASGEWGRFTTASTEQQGDLEEAFHPNAFGQRALGTCLTQLYAQPPGRFTCAGRAGITPAGMQLARVGDLPAPSGGPGPGAAAGCTPAVGFRRAAVRPRRGGLRFVVSRARRRRFDVALFQESAGRRIVGSRLVARFRGLRGSFRWRGRGARLDDGVLVVRFTMRLAGGRRDVRRIALARRGGRFTVLRPYDRRASCGLVRSFRLGRPVFGGTARRSLGIAFRLSRPSSVRLDVLRGGRVVRRLGARVRAARTTHRVRLRARGLRRATYRVRLIATPAGGGTPARAVLAARRL